MYTNVKMGEVGVKELKVILTNLFIILPEKVCFEIGLKSGGGSRVSDMVR